MSNFKETYNTLISNTKEGYQNLKEGQVALMEKTCTYFRGTKVYTSTNEDIYWIGFAIKDGKEMAVMARICQPKHGINKNTVHYKIYLKTFSEAMSMLWAYAKWTNGRNPYNAVLFELADTLQNGFYHAEILNWEEIQKEYTIKYPSYRDCTDINECEQEKKKLHNSQHYTWTIYEII